MWRRWSRLACCFGLLAGMQAAEIPEALRGVLTLHASFEDVVDAAYARGDKRIYNAPSYKEQSAAQPGVGDVDVAIEKGAGVGGGGALRFRSENKAALFFRGTDHVTPAAGTFSFWLKLDPQTELAPGFCDPVQITDKAYNDSAIWVDFTKDERPRHFRLGTFGALKEWNPANRPPDQNPDFTNRLVVLQKPPFAADRWTHIAITWTALGTEKGSATLFVDGKRIGTTGAVRESFSWDPKLLAIRLGVSYTGLMDEVAVFSSALSEHDLNMLRTTAQKPLGPISAH